jgi:hypothetical protein
LQGAVEQALTPDNTQQRTAVKATTAKGQLLTDYAFLAEQLVVFASLRRKAGASSEV